MDKAERAWCEGRQVTNIPIAKIRFRQEIRKFSTENLADATLLSSVKKYGILESLLVQSVGGDYVLIAGERRLRASVEAGLETVPALIVENSFSDEDLALIRMIENLARENPGPIGEAVCYLSYCQSAFKCSNPQDAIDHLHLHAQKHSVLDSASKEKFSALFALTGKCSRTIQNLLQLLLLPAEVQDAINDGRISRSQGYIFVKYLDNPNFNDVFQRRLEKDRMKNAELVSLFLDKHNADPPKKSTHFSRVYAPLHKFLQDVRDDKSRLNTQEREKLAELMKAVLTCLEAEQA